MYRDDILRAAAASARLTHQDIEAITGISRPTVAKILNGDSSGRFALHRLHTIAHKLGVPMSQLFERLPAEQADLSLANTTN